MSTITIPRKEYEKLVETKYRFDYMQSVFERGLFSPPPTKDIKKVLREFSATGLYGRKFLTDLERGLRRSTYFRS